MQLNLHGVPEHQESTCQIPCGGHTIWEALAERKTTNAECYIYQVLNKDSDWETAQSRAKSYAGLEKQTGMPRASVITCVNSLIEKGWLKKNVRNALDKHGQNTANTYILTQYMCEPDEIPLDKDGRLKKCAVPMGQGSPFQLVEEGVIHWKDALYWIRSKIESDWTSGIVCMTIAEAKKLLRMTTKTVCRIRRKLQQVGLAERISKQFRAFVCQLFPKPYEKRRTRRRLPNPKGMRSDKDFYYSHNGRWRLSREDGHFETKIEGSSAWRHANEFELESTNDKIYADFMKMRELFTSESYRNFRDKPA